jgi:hypothetical protein
MSKTNFQSLLLVALVSVIVIAGGFFVYDSGVLNKLIGQGGEAAAGKASGYSAVFLSNGQVYFGKASNLSDQYPEIVDVYYLRVNQKLQPGQAGAAESVKVEKTTGKEATKSAQPVAPTAPQNELNLIKLGGEIHGPMDRIRVNRDHVVFVENLKEESKVVKAIREYQQKNPS